MYCLKRAYSYRNMSEYYYLLEPRYLWYQYIRVMYVFICVWYCNKQLLWPQMHEVNNFKYLSVFSVSRFKFETEIPWINSLNIHNSTGLSVKFWKCVRPFVLYYSTERVEVVKRAVYKKLSQISHVSAISTFRAKYVNIRNTLEWFRTPHDFRIPQEN
jgi:hypothetical protein